MVWRNPLIGSRDNYTGNGGCGGMVSILLVGVLVGIYYFLPA
jgi:hypothetical protein